MSTLRIPTARAFVPLLEPARDKVAHGGRGSGKSHFFGGLMVEDCLAEPGNSGGQGLLAACLREVQKDLAQSAKRLIENKLIEHGLGEPDGFKVYEDCIQTPGDGLVIFKGMNNYTSESIKSLEGYKRAWWEEAHTATLKSINLLRPTMRAGGSQMWWSYNRNKKNDPVDVMFTGPETPTGAIVVQANWRDNPWFTAELEQERQDCIRMQPDQYEHIWEGDYVSIAAGAYFASDLTKAKSEGRIGRVAFDPLMSVRLFFDIGGTGARADACSIWPAQFIAREIRVRDYYEAVGQPLAAHVAWLRANGYGPDRASIWLPHDGATHDKVFSVSYESALRDAGYDVTVIPNQGKGAAGARIEAARRMFPSVWFDEESTEAGRDALGWYHERKDEKRNIGLGPEHDWSSHCFTADTEVLTRYGMRRIDSLEETGEVLTPCGWKQYRSPRMTRASAPLVEVRFSDGLTVKCTPDHLFWTASGWISASALLTGSLIQSSLTRSRSISMAAYTVFGRVSSICRRAVNACTETFGALLSALSPRDATYTIATATSSTTPSRTWSAWTGATTCLRLGTKPSGASQSISRKRPVEPLRTGTSPMLVGFGTAGTRNARRVGRSGGANRSTARSVAPSFRRWFGRVVPRRSIAPVYARPLRIESVVHLTERADVWDITVPVGNWFSLSNGAVVHNCADAFGLMCVAYEEPRVKRAARAVSGGWMG